MIEERKTSSFYAKHFVVLNLIKDPLLALFVVFLHDNGIYQIVPCLVLSGSFTICNIAFKPFFLKRHNFLVIVNQLMYFLSDLGFLLLAIGKDSISVENKAKFLGNYLIVVISLLIFFNVANSIYEMWLSFKRWRRMRAEKKRLAQVGDAGNQ